MEKYYIYILYDTKYNVLHVDKNIRYDQVVTNLVMEVPEPSEHTLEQQDRLRNYIKMELDKANLHILEINDGSVEEIGRIHFINSVTDKVIEKYK